jgi:hypothetical protein
MYTAHWIAILYLISLIILFLFLSFSEGNRFIFLKLLFGTDNQTHIQFMPHVIGLSQLILFFMVMHESDQTYNNAMNESSNMSLSVVALFIVFIISALRLSACSFDIISKWGYQGFEIKQSKDNGESNLMLIFLKNCNYNDVYTFKGDVKSADKKLKQIEELIQKKYNTNEIRLNKNWNREIRVDNLNNCLICHDVFSIDKIYFFCELKITLEYNRLKFRIEGNDWNIDLFIAESIIETEFKKRWNFSS